MFNLDFDPKRPVKVRKVRKNKDGTFSVVQQKFLSIHPIVIGTFRSSSSAYAHLGRLTVDDQKVESL